MSIEDSYSKFHRVTQYVTHRRDLDDPTLSLECIYGKLALDVSNEEFTVDLPLDAMEILGINGIAPNNISRIRLLMDGMCDTYSFYL